MLLNSQIEEFLKERGALRVAFADLESLRGGPPSADLTYILPEGRSAISFALPLDREKIRAFLGKQNQAEHEADNIAVNRRISQVGKELAAALEQQGHAASRVHANLVYRQDTPDWRMVMHPDLSHRYVAVASGLGSFGWSGNVGIPGYGTAVILGTVVTAAELEPGTPIPDEESFCTRCKLCAASCAGSMFSKQDETTVELGGRTFAFAKRDALAVCDFV
jgi:epoxyqueuosine reductase QueG